MSVESGKCSYKLMDSSNILNDETGQLNNDTVVNVKGYDILELSYTLNSSAQGYGTHNSSASGSSTAKIINLTIE